jgi:hypothetical protein
MDGRMINKMAVFFKEKGLVPVHFDQKYRFVSSEPQRIGDQAIIVVEEGGLNEPSEEINVILLKSHGMVKDSTYLVRL